MFVNKVFTFSMISELCTKKQEEIGEDINFPLFFLLIPRGLPDSNQADTRHN